jgi:dipeptidyl aminopeptidase/acylaminoacyl peptidase
MEKRVVLRNRQNKKIIGIFNIPRTKPPFSAVIICHGFKGYKEQVHLRSLAGELCRRGILAFRFDFTNEVGESDGDIFDISFRRGLTDLRAVVDHLCRQKFIDNKRLGLAGHSLGGQMILHYAPADKRIKVLADLAGVIDWRRYPGSTAKQVGQNWEAIKKAGYYVVESRGKRKKYRIKADFFKELQGVNTLAQIKKIHQPIVIVHGTNDGSVPLAQSRWCYRLLSSQKKLALIKGAPHTWKQPKYYKIINPIVADWFTKYL